MEKLSTTNRMETNLPIKVMLVDDHALVRNAIRHLLQDAKGIEVVAEAGSGEDATRVARETLPDVVLMDFDMPGVSGLEATDRLLHTFPSIKVIIVSAFTHEVVAFRLLKAGASGFVPKGASAEEIIKAIRTVKNGEQFINEELANRLALSGVDDPRWEAFNKLSDKELQMIFMIAKGMRTKDISEKLHLSAKTVSAYRSSIFAKLDVENEVQLITLAMKHRLVDVDKI